MPARAFIHFAGIAFSGNPSRTRAFLKARSDEEGPMLTFIRVEGNRFLEHPLSHKSLSQSILGKGASACVRSCCGQALSRAAPFAQKPFPKHPRTMHDLIHIAGKRFLGRALSRKSLSPSTLGQGGASACTQSFALQSFLELPLSHAMLSQDHLGKVV